MSLKQAMKSASSEYKKGSAAPKKKSQKKRAQIKHEGGAIRESVKTQDFTVAVPDDTPPAAARVDFYDRLVPRIPTVLHGAPRILLEAGAPFFMLRPPSYSDDFLLTDLKRVAAPGGMSEHHPEVRQAVFDSFEKHPRLLQHYLRS